jgi:hypothetical protein
MQHGIRQLCKPLEPCRSIWILARFKVSSAGKIGIVAFTAFIPVCPIRISIHSRNLRAWTLVGRREQAEADEKRREEGGITRPAYHVVLAVQTLRARSACSASRADALVWTAARGVIPKTRAIPPKIQEHDNVAREFYRTIGP